jgi:DNA-binding transcriptional LysR family regulator
LHRRYQYINIPTEVVRSIVVIGETGNFSKAGERLGLSQPAVSAQVKRLQLLVGGALFEKTAAGLTFTPKGKLILAQARKLLEANDQILSLGGSMSDSQSIRVGVATLFGELFVRAWSSEPRGPQVSFLCDNSPDLTRSFGEGHLDVACLVDPPPESGEPVFTWEEDYVWVRSPRFLLRAGEAIPLVTWSGTLAEQPMIHAMEKAGLSYRIALTSADYHLRATAVAAGIGLMAMPRRHIFPDLVMAKEHFLPPMRALRVAVFVKPGIAMKLVVSVVETFKAIAIETPRTEPARLKK